jgi:hypothetical protein
MTVHGSRRAARRPRRCCPPAHHCTAARHWHVAAAAAAAVSLAKAVCKRGAAVAAGGARGEGRLRPRSRRTPYLLVRRAHSIMSAMSAICCCFGNRQEASHITKYVSLDHQRRAQVSSPGAAKADQRAPQRTHAPIAPHHVPTPSASSLTPGAPPPPLPNTSLRGSDGAVLQRERRGALVGRGCRARDGRHPAGPLFLGGTGGSAGLLRAGRGGLPSQAHRDADGDHDTAQELGHRFGHAAGAVRDQRR